LDISVTLVAQSASSLLHPRPAVEIVAICNDLGLGTTDLNPLDSKRSYVKARVWATPKDRLTDIMERLLSEFRSMYREANVADQQNGAARSDWTAAFEALEAEVNRSSGVLRPVPRNLVFATIGKPDLVFVDVTQGIVGDVSRNALVFTTAPSSSVLTYGELAAWWKEVGDSEKLSDRLYRSRGSEAEGKVFKFYAEKFVPHNPVERGRYPALLPQVWLHFDPVTLQGRKGKKVLPRQRMDYMMLLSSGPVIIEVDGPQHINSMDTYAEMMAADRGLTLLGYRIFRIAVSELDRQDYQDMLERLFRSLLSQHSTR